MYLFRHVILLLKSISYTLFIVYVNTFIAMASPDNAEVDCLTKTLYFEARGEPPAGNIAIAYTVINRLKDVKYPKTICKVVHETRDGACQYSWYCSHRFTIPEDKKAWRLSLIIARMVLDKDRKISDPTHGALHYVEKSANVSWTKGFRDYVTLGNHRFYFERKEYP